MIIIAFIIGIALGAAAVAARAARRAADMNVELQLARREAEAIRGTRDEWSAELRAISGDAVRQASEQLVALAGEQRRADGERVTGEMAKHTAEIKRLVDPVAQSTLKVEQEIQKLERDRRQAHGQLSEMMRGLNEGVTGLKSETGNLVSALRRPQTRGAWGEIQLRRVAEMAGMIDHCDFVEQHTVDGAEGRLRPDMIVKMPGDKVVVVDSKVPLDAYLSAIEATDDDARVGHLKRHARQVRDHMTKLASKNYAREFETPELVVLFIPSDGIWEAALQEDAALLEYGADQHVLVATPTSLIALLRAVHYGWRQERIAESARDIAAAGQELHQRIGVFLGAFQKVGRQLGSATAAFNDAVGSMEARVLPSLRRLEESGARSGRDAGAPERIEPSPRLVTAPELVVSVDDELAELAGRQITVRAVPDEPA
jgi:DNA recombination protein RmuC